MKMALYVGGPAAGRLEAVDHWGPSRVYMLFPEIPRVSNYEVGELEDITQDHVEYERHLGLPPAYDHNGNEVAIYTTRDMETEEVLAALMSNYRPLFPRR